MASSAIVARTNAKGLEYLVHIQEEFAWAPAERDASLFENLRDATRAAMRLPARFRAFALPSSSEAL